MMCFLTTKERHFPHNFRRSSLVVMPATNLTPEARAERDRAARDAIRAAKAEVVSVRKDSARVLKELQKRLKIQEKEHGGVLKKLAKYETKAAAIAERRAAKKEAAAVPAEGSAVECEDGGALPKPKKELSPALQLWRSTLARHGIKGVLRKSDPRYELIREEYERGEC